MPIRMQSRRVPRSKPARQHPRHAAGARSPGAPKPASPAYLGLARLDRLAERWDDERFVLPLLAVAVVVAWVLWVLAGSQPVSAFPADRPSADATVEVSTAGWGAR